MKSKKRIPAKRKATKAYGVYNGIKKEFQFGIEEPTEKKAWEALIRKIGRDAHKWRFEIKYIPMKYRKEARRQRGLSNA